VDAYFPLAAAPGADRAALLKGAQKVAGRLARAARRSGRPVLLTEVGFAARREAWMSPHLEGGEYSEDDQATAYEALFSALGRQPWLAGTFLWKAFSSPEGEGGRRRSSSDFRFQGRRAEAVIGRYYSQK
jgi:glycosyl hydrolase family 113